MLLAKWSEENNEKWMNKCEVCEDVEEFLALIKLFSSDGVDWDLASQRFEVKNGQTVVRGKPLTPIGHAVVRGKPQTPRQTAPNNGMSKPTWNIWQRQMKGRGYTQEKLQNMYRQMQRGESGVPKRSEGLKAIKSKRVIANIQSRDSAVANPVPREMPDNKKGSKRGPLIGLPKKGKSTKHKSGTTLKEDEAKGDAAAKLAPQCSSGIRENEDDVEVDAQGGLVRDDDASKEVVVDSFCPLTMKVLRDPVITADGQTYERTEIASWFELGNKTSPLTGAELPSTHLTSNIALRNAIQESGLIN
jgi:hypothetical protein